MFTGRYEAIPASGEIVQPSTAESMTATFKADYLLPFELIPGLDKQKRQQMFDRVNALQLEAQGRGVQEGGVQQSANWIASMAGSILNPLSLATGEAAGVAVKAAAPEVATFTGRYLPSESKAFLARPVGELIGSPENFATKESIASLSETGFSAFAQATGFTLPSEVARTYNPKSDTFNWQQGIKSSFEDGGLGFLLMAAPYAAGTLWGKLFGKEADHSKLPLPGETTRQFNVSHIDKAVEDKLFSAEEGQWLKDYLYKSDTTDNLSQRAIQMLIKDGHPVDAATKQVIFKILKPEDVANLQYSISDKLAASHLPKSIKNVLHDYISKNAVDNLSEHPTSVIDGIKGVTTFVRKKLLADKEINNEKIFYRGKSSYTFGYKSLEEAGVTEESLMKNDLWLGKGYWYADKLEHAKKYGEVIETIKGKYKIFDPEKSKNRKLVNIYKRINQTEKLKLIPDESGENKLVKEFRDALQKRGYVGVRRFGVVAKDTAEYETMFFKKPTSSKVDEKIKNTYELHKSYTTVLDTLTKMMRSEFGKLAKSEDVVNYMRERIQTRVPEFENLEAKDLKDDIRISKEKLDKAYEQVKTPEGRDEALKAFDEEMKDTKAKEIKEEYDEVKAQYEEFKENPTVFSNLIQCVLGGISG